MNAQERDLSEVELAVLDVARGIAAEGLSPNNNRLFNRLRWRLAHDHPNYQSVKNARARLAELGLLPTPARVEAAHVDR